MVEKHYCDVCGEETDQEKNVNVASMEGKIGVDFDVCKKCLKKKNLFDLLLALGEQSFYVTINLPHDYWKGGD